MSNGNGIKLTLVACLLTILALPSLKASNAAEANLKLIPGTITQDFGKMPPEAQVLFNALVGALRGERRIDAFGPVTFEYPVMQNIKTLDSFTYQGMDVTDFQLTYIGLDDKTKSKTLIGIIHWFDENNKRAAATPFGVTYRPIGGTLFIRDVRVDRMPPNMPRIAMFVVPKKKVEKQLKNAAKDFISLLALASKNAIRAGGMGKADGSYDYLILTFSLDRLGRGDRLDLLLNLKKSEKTKQTSIRPEFQKLIDYSGFQVAVMEMRFDLTQDDPVWLEVFYTPTKLHPTLSAKPHMAARYPLTKGR